MTRTAILTSLALSSSALACQMPPDAIQLASKMDYAPMAYVQMDALPVSAPFVMTFTICDPAKTLETLTFDALMPAHGHGMNFNVDVSRIGNNQFEVSNIVFHMPGLWEFEVETDGAGENYTYTAAVSLR